MKQLSIFDLAWRKGKVFFLTAQSIGFDFCISKGYKCFNLLIHSPNEIPEPYQISFKELEDAKQFAQELVNNYSK